jgi:hypothetical protein
MPNFLAIGTLIFRPVSMATSYFFIISQSFLNMLLVIDEETELHFYTSVCYYTGYVVISWSYQSYNVFYLVAMVTETSILYFFSEKYNNCHVSLCFYNTDSSNISTCYT